jgi:tetratricopeptide (TPR) repeat protein
MLPIYSNQRPTSASLYRIRPEWNTARVLRPAHRWLLLGAVFLGCVGFGLWTTASRRTAAALERGDLTTAAAIQNRLAWFRLDEADHRYALARALVAEGRLDDAVAQYQRGLAREPRGEQWAALAAIHRSRGELEAAIQAWERGFEINRNRRYLHRASDLLLKHGDRERSFEFFERALLVDAPSARVHAWLAAKAESLGLARQQIHHLRAALAFDPTLFRLRSSLAWLLATQDDPQLRDSAEAVPLAEALASESARRDAATLDLLATALASDGRFDEAVVVAAEARDRAERDGESELAEAIRQRLVLYRSGQAFHENPAADARS